MSIQPLLIIEELVIMIVSKTQKQPFKLTRKHVYQPEQREGYLSESVYIASNILYNRKFLLKLKQTNRMLFLFNKPFFTKQTQKMITKNNLDIDTKNNKDYFYQNVLITLELLFPTHFPVQSNNANSYDQYINNEPVKMSSSISIISPVKYSYIKLGNKPYTIIKSVWLNDYINHPLYKTLYNEYITFINWKADETLIIQEESNYVTLKVKESYNTYFQPIIKNEIQSIGENISTIKSKYTNANTRTKYISLIDRFTKLHEDVIAVNNLNEDVPLTETYISNMYDKFNDINYFINKYEGELLSPILSKIFKTNVKLIYNILERAYLVNKIKNLYFNDAKINMNIDNEEPPIIELLKSKYSRYVNFINLLVPYLKRKTTNDNFQKMMIDFSKNANSEFQRFNDQIYNMLNNNVTLEKRYTELCNIGANIISNRETDNKLSNGHFHYEIYVGLDIIDGKIDDSNKNNIGCDFKSLYLGNKLENVLSGKNNIIYQPEYYEFNEDALQSNQTKPEPRKTQKGGITRNLRRCKMKTTHKNKKIMYRNP